MELLGGARLQVVDISREAGSLLWELRNAADEVNRNNSCSALKISSALKHAVARHFVVGIITS